jgi:hypothetical protein
MPVLRPTWHVVVFLGAASLLAGCGRETDSADPSPRSHSATNNASRSNAVAGPVANWFEDATSQTGLEFKHEPGSTAAFRMPASIGSGSAWLDINQDDRLDLYLVQGDAGVKNQLFRQQADGTFSNVSSGSGLDVSGDGMGVAVGDVNNDGRVDVLLTEVGRARLFSNRGEGKFEEVTTTAGIDNSRWGTAASFLDYDRDGWLDLVIVNYVDYSPTTRCFDSKGQLEFCGPQGMPGTATRLFRNRGQEAPGQFADVSVSSGVARKTGAGLGVLAADLNGDHWCDILVADDGMPNRLFINQRNGTFTDEAVQRGLAFNAFGTAAANMGIAWGDVDGNGFADVFIPHVSWEQHSMWMQGPAGLFLDQAVAAGLANPRLRGTGFGTVLADLDLDGDLDLVVGNGRIRRGDLLPPFTAGMDPFWQPYAQPNQLFRNDGTGRFQDISEGQPVFCENAGVYRGLAMADYDNDGDIDLITMATGAPARLFRNVTRNAGSWLIVRAIDPALGGRDAYGAEIAVTSGPRRWHRLIQPSSSYLVSNDPRAHFGLGALKTVERLEVLWPDGAREQFPGGTVNRGLVLKKGSGSPL